MVIVSGEPVDMLVTENKHTGVATHVTIEFSHITRVDTKSVTIEILVLRHLDVKHIKHILTVFTVHIDN